MNFSDFSTFGFSGSRRRIGLTVPLAVLAETAAQVPVGSRVLTGCASGVDSYYRHRFPGAEVFSVQSGKYGKGKGAFAARSAACVRAVSGDSGLWVSFPAAPCPDGLLPSRLSSECFCGSGSGTWASFAFALGSGCACCLWLPDGISPPALWRLERRAGGWWWSPPATSRQLSLFS
jgi:hypothetical protein